MPHFADDLRSFSATLQRRRTLAWLLGTGALPLIGCGGGGDSDGSSASTGTETGTTGDTVDTAASTGCAVIPSETEGPYPADGTNTVSGSVVNALGLSGIVRSDIRASLPASLGSASGVPLTITLQLVNTNAGCASLAGYAVYLWHCDAQGRYSMYSSGVTAQNYLRGVQVSDANGQVSFTTIFPGCYSGRWPHAHFEIFSSLARATSGSNDVKTSQLALPDDICRLVYATSDYPSSNLTNLNAITLARDGIFGDDGAALQLATVTGSVATGFVAALEVGIAA